MILTDLKKEILIKLLIDVVHSMVMYKAHKQYISELTLQEKFKFKPREMAARLNIPLGEALVILHDLEEAKEKI